MVEIKILPGHDGYGAVAEYIDRYVKRHMCLAVIVSMEISHTGETFDSVNVVVDCSDDENKAYIFEYDWWEGEKYIKILGIKDTGEISVTGGLYEEGDLE